MLSDTLCLDVMARIFGVHPRTILRAVSGDYYVYWNEDDRDALVALPVSLIALAQVYGTTVEKLHDCVNGKDVLLRPEDAAKFLGIKPRALRSRVGYGYYTKVGSKGVVRYLRSELVNDLIARTPVE